VNFRNTTFLRASEWHDLATSDATVRAIPRTSLNILLPVRCRGLCEGSGSKNPKSITCLQALFHSQVRDAPHGKKQDAVADRRVSELRAETRSQNLTHRARGQEASLELLGAGVGRRYARPTSPRRAHPTMLVEGGRRDAASV
jgi:hypothetical protein